MKFKHVFNILIVTTMIFTYIIFYTDMISIDAKQVNKTSWELINLFIAITLLMYCYIIAFSIGLVINFFIYGNNSYTSYTAIICFVGINYLFEPELYQAFGIILGSLIILQVINFLSFRKYVKRCI